MAGMTIEQFLSFHSFNSGLCFTKPERARFVHFGVSQTLNSASLFHGTLLAIQIYIFESADEKSTWIHRDFTLL